MSSNKCHNVSKIPSVASPFSQGAYQMNRFDMVLPEEIWEMILKLLDNSTDLLNASYASPIFNCILHKKKHIWMFEQVLPHIFKDLRKSDLLNLRQVCKPWNLAVDSYVASHPSLQPFNEHTFRTVQSYFNYLPLSAKVTDDIAFINGEQFEDFMDAMDGHPRNPFFGRSIRIGSCGDLFDSIDDAIDNTWEGASHLCEQFGSHLWHVEFANYEFSLSCLDFYKGVSRSLVHLPNLKALHMNGALDTCEEDDGNLLEYMGNNPLPDLPHLESVIFDLVMETEPVEEEILERQNMTRNLPQNPDALVEYLQAHPEAIQQLLSEIPPTPDNLQDKFLTTYGSQLKKLEIDLQSWREGYGTLLANLTEIHLKHVNSISVLKSLLHGLKTGHQLGKLILSMRCSMKISELFEILAPLRIINLDFGYLGEAPDDYLVETKGVNLPNVSSLLFLRIKDTIDMTYEFLRNLPSLQHLDVWECQNARNQFHEQQKDTSADQQEMDTSVTDELRKLIYKGQGCKQKVRSRIWKLLSSLKVITYRTRSGLPQVIKRFSRDAHSWEYKGTY